jgi:oligosaccharide repeat unit polymerase
MGEKITMILDFYNKFIRSFVLVFSFLFITYAFYLDSLKSVYIAILLIFLHNILYATKGIKKRIVFLSFHIAFFTVLLARIFLGLITVEGIYTPFNNNELNMHIAYSLYISLFCVFLGSVLSNKLSFKLSIEATLKRNFNKYHTKDYIQRIRFVSFILMFVAFIPSLIQELEILHHFRATSYEDIRLSYNSALPLILIRLSKAYMISFCIFLATLPSKKQCIFPILGYVLLGFISLLYGIRGDFILNLLFILIYFVIRDNLESTKSKPWFGKRELIICILLIPLLVSHLYVIGNTRFGDTVSNTNMLETFEKFLDAQGTSVDLIGYGKLYEEEFPTGKFYMLGGVIDFFQQNAFTKLFIDIPFYETNTIGRALYGNSFAQTISYIVMPGGYLAGRGMGSSYIAEAFHDLGYFGVIFINVLFGFMMGKIGRFKTSNIWIAAIYLMMIKGIIYIPRSETDAFITSFLNVPSITAFSLIIIGAIFMNSKNKNLISLNDT